MLTCLTVFTTRKEDDFIFLCVDKKGIKKELNYGSLEEWSLTQLWCLSSDQSGVLYEVHESRPQLEENAV